MRTDPNLISRKEVATLLQVSVSHIVKHGSRLGLDAARYDLSERLIRYDRSKVLAMLERFRRAKR